jgi:hypothetical protein
LWLSIDFAEKHCSRNTGSDIKVEESLEFLKKNTQVGFGFDVLHEFQKECENDRNDVLFWWWIELDRIGQHSINQIGEFEENFFFQGWIFKSIF